MKNKIIIIASPILILISIFITINILLKKEEQSYNIPEGSTLVENTNVLKDQKIDNLLISNVLLYTKNEKSIYSANITNESSKDETVNLIISFYEGEYKTDIQVLYDKIIKSKENNNIEVVFEIDLTKITKIEYKMK